MELFDVISAMFDRRSYQNVTVQDKKNHYYMINRIISIQYPEQCQTLNSNDISIEAKPFILDYWHSFFIKRYSKKPSWLYTKSKKNTIDDSFKKIKPEAIKYYCDNNHLSESDYKFLTVMFKDELIQELTVIQNNL